MLPGSLHDIWIDEIVIVLVLVIVSVIVIVTVTEIVPPSTCSAQGGLFFWHRAWSPDVDDQRRAINANTVHLFGMGDAASSGSAERLNWTEADEAKLVG